MNNTFVLDVLLTWACCIRSTWNAQNWFIDGAVGRTRTFEWFSNSSWGNCGWRLWVFRSFLHRLHRRKHAESLQKSQWRLPKYHFEDCWQGRLVWNMSVNYKGGLEHGRPPWNLCHSYSLMSRSSKNFWLLKTWLWSTSVIVHLTWLMISSWFK